MIPKELTIGECAIQKLPLPLRLTKMLCTLHLPQKTSIKPKKRLIIQRRLIGQNITLRIQYENSNEIYEIKHDDLVELVKQVKPATIQTKSWIEKGIYHWPSLSKEMRLALISCGSLISE